MYSPQWTQPPKKKNKCPEAFSPTLAIAGCCKSLCPSKRWANLCRGPLGLGRSRSSHHVTIPSQLRTTKNGLLKLRAPGTLDFEPRKVGDICDMLYSQVPWLLYRYIILISPWVSSQFPPPSGPSATFAWHGWPLHRAWCPSGPSSRPRPRPACPDHVGQSSCRKLFLIGDIPTPLKNDGVRQIGSSSQLLGKIKNVPNHQPVFNGKVWKIQKLCSFFYVFSWVFVYFVWDALDRSHL